LSDVERSLLIAELIEQAEAPCTAVSPIDGGANFGLFELVAGDGAKPVLRDAGEELQKAG